jgi:hypothetical protein
MPAPSALPYTDEKPVGAADFYTAINATFRFVFDRLGREGLLRYWRDMGQQYFAPVGRRWRDGGLAAVEEYWRAFFIAEPGADVEVRRAADEVVLEVRRCPAIAHLRAMGREIVPYFCQHCYFVGESISQSVGMSLRLEGGGGCCTQRVRHATEADEPQNLNKINVVS